MNSRYFLLSVAFAVVVAEVFPAHGAALTTAVVQANADPNHWNAPIWDPGPVSPMPGNTYEVLSGARVRTPNGTVASGGNATDGQTFTFPGDALILTGELRFKQSFNFPIFNFPGVGGNAGLVLNGGILNDGEERIMTIAGLLRTSTDTISSINPGGQNPTDISAARGFIITGMIVGDGGLAVDYGHDSTAAEPALRIDSSNPNFTGEWTINSGWVQGVGANAFGLGNITLTSNQGASTLDYNYAAVNPTTVVTLIGPTSTLILDQNLTFGRFVIDGTALTPGLHTFAELNAAFDANIVNGGNGTITIVPEPCSLAFALLAAIPIVSGRRRPRPSVHSLSGKP